MIRRPLRPAVVQPTTQNDEPDIDALPDHLAEKWIERFAEILPTMRGLGQVYTDVQSVALHYPDLLENADWVDEAVAAEGGEIISPPD